MGLANTELDDDHILTEKIQRKRNFKAYEYRYDLCCLLFQAYGAEHDEYNAIFGDVNDYEVPIIDLFMYVHEKMDLGVINLDEDQTNDINDLYDKLTDSEDQTSEMQIIITKNNTLLYK